MSVPDPPDPRIDTTLKRDLAIGVTFTVVMWVVLLFAFAVVVQIAPGTALRVVLGVSMVVLGVFNTASMVALIQRYREHRVAIYSEDLRHLDAARAAKGARNG